MLTHEELKARALDRANVKAEYARLDEEFALLDEFLKARTAAGITQTEVARLESWSGKHSQSLATLQKYAHALGCRLELRLVNEAIKTSDLTKHSTGRAKKSRVRLARRWLGWLCTGEGGAVGELVHSRA